MKSLLFLVGCIIILSGSASASFPISSDPARPWDPLDPAKCTPEGFLLGTTTTCDCLVQRPHDDNYDLWVTGPGFLSQYDEVDGVSWYRPHVIDHDDPKLSLPGCVATLLSPPADEWCKNVNEDGSCGDEPYSAPPLICEIGNGTGTGPNSASSTTGDPALKLLDPVRVYSGEFFFKDNDLSIKGRGLDINWSREYRSKFQSNTGAGLGSNWDHAYNLRFSMETVLGNVAVTHEGPRTVQEFVPYDCTNCIQNGGTIVNVVENIFSDPYIPTYTYNPKTGQYDVSTCPYNGYEHPENMSCLELQLNTEEQNCAYQWDYLGSYCGGRSFLDGSWYETVLGQYEDVIIDDNETYTTVERLPIYQVITVYEGNHRRQEYRREFDFNSDEWEDEFYTYGTTQTITYDDTTNTFSLLFSNYTVWEMKPFNYDGNSDTINDYEFWSTTPGYVNKIIDRNGNEISLTWDQENRRLDKITDTYSRDLNVYYGSSGNSEDKIDYIEDFSGRIVDYTYDIEGRLISSNSPSVSTSFGNDYPSGKKRSYSYLNDTSKITRIYDGRASDPNHPFSTQSQDYFVKNTYDSNGRVTSQEWGDGTVSIYKSNEIPIMFSGNEEAHRVIINDREGRVVEAYYDKHNRIRRYVEYTGFAPNAATETTETVNRPTGKLRSGDPDYFETLYEWDAYTGKMTKQVYPAGNSTEYIYANASSPSMRGPKAEKLLEVRQVAAPGSGFSDIVQEFTYDDNYGCGSCGEFFPVTETDPLGNITVNTYDANYNITTKRHPDATLISGGFMENITSNTLQVIVENWEYNSFGLPKKYTDPEGNVTRYEYYAESDPDGDGFDVNTGLSTTTGGDGGGYLSAVVIDTARDILTSADSNSGTNPTPTEIRQEFYYDRRGNVIKRIDGRGVSTEFEVNQLDQTVRMIKASSVGNYTSLSPTEPLTIFEYDYEERYWFDAANNMIAHQIMDEDNLTSVDGDIPSADLAAVGLTTIDASSGTAFVDTIYKHNVLGSVIEIVQEVGDGEDPIITQYRYNKNEQNVLTVLPEGNANASLYDERGLPYQTIRGVQSVPSSAVATPKLTSNSVAGPFNRDGGNSVFNSSVVTFAYDGNKNLVERIDSVDDGGANSTLTSETGDTSKYIYNAINRLKKQIDPMGNETIYVYDGESKVIRVIEKGAPLTDVAGDSGNATLSVSEKVYDELDRLVTSHELLFKTPSASVNPTVTLTDNALMDAVAAYLGDATSDTATSGNMSDITLIGRVSTVYEYDRNGRLMFQISDDFDVSRTDYDGAGRVIKTTDSAISNGWSVANSEFEEASLSGNSTEYAYDDNGNVIESLQTDVSNVTGLADQEIRTTAFYDSLNRNTVVIDNVPYATYKYYDSLNNLRIAYDGMNDSVTYVGPRRGLGSTTAIVTNQKGNATLYEYDGVGRLRAEYRPLTASGKGEIASSAPHSKLGWATSLVGAPGPGFDSNQAGDGLIQIDYAYDKNSNIVARRDDNGNVTAYIYDNQDRQYIERRGLQTTFTTLAITGGNTAKFINTQVGTIGTDTEANGTNITYTFDLDSKINTKTDEAGNVFTMFYDGNHRKTQVDITRASGFVGTTQQTKTYDGFGRVLTCSDNNDTGTADDMSASYVYDSLSRKIYETQKIGTYTAKVLTFDFDSTTANSEYQPSSVTYPDGRKINNLYDNLNRLVSRTDNGYSTPIGEYEYLGPYSVASLTYQNDTRLTHLGNTSGTPNMDGFDGLLRIKNHRWEKINSQPYGSGTLLVGFEHQTATGDSLYDAAHNKLIEYKTHDPSNSEKYRYDSAYRLASPESGQTSAGDRAFERGTFTDGDRNSMSTIVKYQDWDIDGAQNWSTMYNNSTTAINSSLTEYNELTLFGPGYQYTFDKNGNRIGAKYTDFDYQYDAYNRLVLVNLEYDGTSHHVRYSYDCDNRRRVKTVANGGPVEDSSLDGTTHYYYEGWRVIEEYDVVSSVETLDKQLVYGNYLDEVWVVDDRYTATVADLNDGSGDDRVFVHANTQYSIHGLTNETGDLVEAYEYDPYGKLTVIADGNDGDSIVNFSPNDVRTVSGKSAFGLENLYTGQRFDHETGNYYYKNRYYDPEIGRFLTRDPIGVWGDSYNFGNGYGYVGNRPHALSDPVGELTLDSSCYTDICGSMEPKILPDTGKIRELINGLKVDEEKVESPRMREYFQSIINCMKKHLDEIVIKCDGALCNEPTYSGYNESQALPSMPNKSIYICVENHKNKNTKITYEYVIMHELSHACGILEMDLEKIGIKL